MLTIYHFQYMHFDICKWNDSKVRGKTYRYIHICRSFSLFHCVVYKKIVTMYSACLYAFLCGKLLRRVIFLNFVNFQHTFSRNILAGISSQDVWYHYDLKPSNLLHNNS